MGNFFKNWYHGKTEIQTFDELNKELGSYVGPLIYIERHWTARIVGALVDFCMRHWQFICGTIISIATLYCTYLTIK